jgi:hypothetical protein
MRNLKDINNETNTGKEYEESNNSKQKERKVNALETVYKQAVYASKNVTGKDGREFVRAALELGSSMVKNPDGDFKNEINRIIGEYQVLPKEDKKELTFIARNNISFEKARELIEFYWK